LTLAHKIGFFLPPLSFANTPVASLGHFGLLSLNVDAKKNSSFDDGSAYNN
jgi:hypothetical protein